MLRKKFKEINIEEFTSRLPGVWPGYSAGTLYFFDSASVDDGDLMSNYGTYPVNLWLKFNEDNVPSLIPFSSQEGVYSQYELFTYQRISECYAFFRKYYWLLNHGGNCSRVYSSATEYYETESRGSYARFMAFGTDEDTYRKMDEEFARNHGKIQLNERIVECDGDVSGYSSVSDAGFFGYICTKLVPSVAIPSEYRDGWQGKEALYVPDARRWLGWFKENKGSEDCCIGIEYKRRGGDKMSEILDDFLSSVDESIISRSQFTVPEGLLVKYWVPKAGVTILGADSLVSIGQRRPLAEDYVLGMKYNPGNIVSYDDSFYLKKAAGDSYSFDSNYLDMSFNDDGWDESVEGETVIDKRYYAVKNDGSIVRGETEDKVRQELYDVYGCTEGNMAYVGGEFFPVMTGEVMTASAARTYDKKEKNYLVRRDINTNKPYIVINGNRKFADRVENGYSFERVFGDNTVFPFAPTDDSETRYYESDGAINIVNPTGTQIYHDTCNVMGITYGISANTALSAYTIVPEFMEHDGYSAISYNSSMKSCFLWYSDPDSYIEDGYVMTGTTSSRLELLEYRNTECDKAVLAFDYSSRILNGLNTTGHWVPMPGDILEPMYQVGNVSMLSAFTDIDGEERIAGNIVTAMTVYYKDYNGKIVSETMKACKRFKVIQAISESTAVKNSMTGTSFMDGIFCEIVYCIGATLKYTPESGYTLMPPESGYTDGVTYTEETMLEMKSERFTTRNGIRNASGVEEGYEGYPVYYYDVIRETSYVDDGYGNYRTEYLADFSAGINGIRTKDMFCSVPSASTVATEYDVCQVLPQNAVSDIYIERGVNAAFEKHLKLGEVTNLDALLLYGNGYFSFLSES